MNAHVITVSPALQRLFGTHLTSGHQSNVPYPPPLGRQFATLLGPSVTFEKAGDSVSSEPALKIMPGGAKVLYSKEVSRSREVDSATCS